MRNRVAVCGHERGVIKESERPPVTDWVSTDGFTAIYHDCAERIYNYFLRHGCSAAEAEELTASTFVAAWRARLRIADIDVTPVAYLYGIANNVLRTSWRSGIRSIATHRSPSAPEPLKS